jgi:hypothetical protein
MCDFLEDSEGWPEIVTGGPESRDRSGNTTGIEADVTVPDSIY